MKILIGIDDSAHAKAAVKQVSTFRWPEGTACIVVSAVPVAVTAFSMTEAGAYPVFQDVLREQTKVHGELVAAAVKDLHSAGLSAEARVEPGDPRDVIIRLAQTEQADLVVVGSHGRSGLPKLLMGSVASHVVTHAPCSVLVVKLPR